MPNLMTDTIGQAPTWRGEPGQESPDAVGGWSADDSREYLEHSLREELQTFLDLYGRFALTTIVADVVGGGVDV
jgi:hypothetical protein